MRDQNGIFSHLDNMPKWAVAALSSLATAIAAVWLNYSDFRKTRIEANSAATEQTVQANFDLKPILDKFIALSRGAGHVTQDDRVQLTKAIRQSYDKAEDVRNRLGGLDAEFRDLSSALVQLKEGADNMTGPIDGKQFFLLHMQNI